MQAPDYTTFTKAVAERSSQPQAAFTALCQLTRDIVGVKLFTVMAHDGNKGVASRIYSNMPEVYPVSGTKPANVTDWSRQVIENKQTFVANDIEGIRARSAANPSSTCRSSWAARCWAPSIACMKPASTPGTRSKRPRR